MLFENAIVKEQLQAFYGAQTEMVLAFWADIEVVFNGFTPNDLATAIAFLPEAFSENCFFLVVPRVE